MILLGGVREEGEEVMWGQIITIRNMNVMLEEVREGGWKLIESFKQCNYRIRFILKKFEYC